MISVIPVIIGAFIYIKLNKFSQFVVLSLASLLPISFGNFRSIPNFEIIEWLPLITFIMLINHIVPIGSKSRNRISINFRGVGIFLFALFILFVWTTVNYVDNEILSQTGKNVENIGSFRAYFGIYNNILLFFTTIIFAAVHYEEIDFERFFKFLLYAAIVLGFLRILFHFLELDFPFLSGRFNYGGEYGKHSKIKYGGKAFRFAGLGEVASIGLPALFSYFVFKKKFPFIELVLLLFLLFMSGGRTMMAGTIFAIVLFSFIFFPKNFIYLITIGGLFIVMAVIFLPDVFQGQIGRFITFNSQDSLGIDEGRALGWKLLAESFWANPIWGRGFSHINSTFYLGGSKYAAFAKEIAFGGGHGAYLSVLGIFGIGGITYLLIMVWGGVIFAYNKINQYLSVDTSRTAIAVFAFMILLINGFNYITGTNGLNEPSLFYSVGFLASLSVLQNIENKRNN